MLSRAFAAAVATATILFGGPLSAAATGDDRLATADGDVVIHRSITPP